MRAVVQRVSRGSVTTNGEEVGRVGLGFVALVGVAVEDTEADARALADKIAGLRVFEDAEGKMNLDLSAVGGTLLAVSQFTLLGDVRKGRRPSFSSAMAPEPAKNLFELFVEACRQKGVTVETGRFQATMQVEIVNEGPVTILIDTRGAF
jgi:D-tyrosyl-tRNA(Tyr) deacylase